MLTLGWRSCWLKRQSRRAPHQEGRFRQFRAKTVGQEGSLSTSPPACSGLAVGKSQASRSGPEPPRFGAYSAASAFCASRRPSMRDTRRSKLMMASSTVSKRLFAASKRALVSACNRSMRPLTWFEHHGHRHQDTHQGSDVADCLPGHAPSSQSRPKPYPVLLRPGLRPSEFEDVYPRIQRADVFAVLRHFTDRLHAKVRNTHPDIVQNRTVTAAAITVQNSLRIMPLPLTPPVRSRRTDSASNWASIFRS